MQMQRYLNAENVQPPRAINHMEVNKKIINYVKYVNQRPN